MTSMTGKTITGEIGTVIGTGTVTGIVIVIEIVTMTATTTAEMIDMGPETMTDIADTETGDYS